MLEPWWLDEQKKKKKGNLFNFFEQKSSLILPLL